MVAVIIVVLCSFVSIVLAPESTGSWPRDRWAPLEHTWSQDLLKVSLSFFIAVSFISGKIWKSYIRNGKFASDERYVQTHVCKWGQGFKIPLLWQMSQAPHRGLTIYHAWRHILSETNRVVCQELYWRELLIGKCGCIAQAEIWTWTSRDFTQNKLNSSAVIVEETHSQGVCMPDQHWFLLGKVWVQAGDARGFQQESIGRWLVWLPGHLLFLPRTVANWSVIHPLIQLFLRSLGNYFMVA